MCSLVFKSTDRAPVGTATSYDHYVLVETPLPWQGRVEEPNMTAPELLRIMDAARERGVHFRPMAIAPDHEYSVAGRRRVLFFRRPSGLFARFQRREYVVPDACVAQLVGAYLLQTGALAQFDPFLTSAESDTGVRDFLVCTHGYVDICCGKFGFPIYRRMREAYGSPDFQRLRVWRVSHLGGHRYAPTMMEFPEGRFWGNLTPGCLDSIVRREGALADLSPHHRGWVGLRTPFEQVLEASLLVREGWTWIERPRSGAVLRRLDGGRRAHVRIEAATPQGRIAAYEADVEVTGSLRLRESCSSQAWIEVPEYAVGSIQVNGMPYD